MLVLFARKGIDSLSLTYEDLSADPQGALAEVLVALGLNPKLAEVVETPTARLSDALSQQWADRFRAEGA